MMKLLLHLSRPKVSKMNSMEYSIAKLLQQTWPVLMTEEVVLTLLFFMDGLYSTKKRTLWNRKNDDDQWTTDWNKVYCPSASKCLTKNPYFMVDTQYDRFVVYKLSKPLKMTPCPDIDICIASLDKILRRFEWYQIVNELRSLPQIRGSNLGEAIDTSSMFRN